MSALSAALLIFSVQFNLVRYLPDQKNKTSAASQTVATARIAPKICQGQPPAMWSRCSRFHPNRFNFCV